ncbi:hypothetical protein E1269_14565 [Jiangella asiatica]|uniref:exo-alpha-sialidase n=2 Tax=Jiangella asiatica TaxID=2530372 RepID=A0A4R5DFC0_9ACTN|nr:hypothetical protein E1269_14565 [Jiangella asiatica]
MACAVATVGLLWAASVVHAASDEPVTPASSAAEITYSTIFERGTDGYHTFRIPAIVQSTEGTLLAFAEGRDGANDDSQSDMVLKRSFDGGVTWEPIQVIVDDDLTNKWGNPVPIVDQTTGRIILNVTRTAGEVTGAQVRCGVTEEQTRRSFMMYSDDDGQTWSVPDEITQDVRPDNWRHFVGGPGHGIQLTEGPNAGRLVMAGAHSVAPPEGSGIDCLDDRLFGGHSLYSDNGGATWQLGGDDSSLEDMVNPNESTVVELDDGTLYFSARDQGGTTPGRRAHTTSSDGGASFDAPYQATDGIVTGQIEGSLLKLPTDSGASLIVFSAPDHPTARENVTLWTSDDQAATWNKGLRIYDGPSAYTDLVDLGDQGGTPMLGVIFENGPRLYDQPYLSYHHEVSFARVPVELLDDAQPAPPVTPDTSGNGNDGAVSGTPQSIAGQFGTGFELAGDYVELPQTSSLAFDDGPFTAAMWFRTTSQETQSLIWAHSRTDGEPKWWIRLEPDLNRIRGLLDNGTSTRSVTATGNLADGAWHHVALTRDQNGVVLYVDGVAVGSGTALSGSVSDGARTGIRVGTRVDGINDPLRGSADEVWFFDRALTASEIAALAASNTAPSSGTVAHLPLDQIVAF